MPLRAILTRIKEIQLAQVFVDSRLMDLIPQYLNRIRDTLKNVEGLVEIPDFNAIQNMGHKLSGSGGMYGIDQISKYGQWIESAAILKDRTLVQKLSQDLYNYLNEVEICTRGEK